jgi:hypothetical protein
MIHDRPHHLAQRITYLLRRALGDLFLGPYSVYFGLQASSSTLPSDGYVRGEATADRLWRCFMMQPVG